ncbi:NADH-quinone oxidoreductase subunit E [Sedimentimonas flavescens]|uniref:NADH-quinone oxidoreductase subunit E n=1 Tax=Sedimentimonas flavescens TaxID=2851012 RepID=UPI001C4A5F97|nr:NADH-quinone oxidoreductase subunit E [Sedimentimonas flavescens]MBW0157738.1 NADH-quinone oxidoreductase subunit E [Sedimentimonas flavescens]MCT2540790.1 NADH-quinone oxidoreductase subunit E [Sedimentimonas flavescens]
MLRRLHHAQPESFEFTPANLAWAQAQMTKFPVGRQASAIIPLLFRAQEQEGWLSRPAIEYVADMLGMPYIRALEVATFYFMFQLAPVGSVAHIQICGTTSCMICGSEDLIKVCKEKISPQPFGLSADGKFSWEEVECLGACANAPMAQIGKDYYEDLSEESLAKLIDDMAAGGQPRPGSQTGRFSSEPATGLTSLSASAGEMEKYNGSVDPAVTVGDVVKKIDGSEVALRAPWQMSGQYPAIGIMGAGQRPMSAVQQAAAKAAPAPKAASNTAEAPQAAEPVAAEAEGKKPEGLAAPRDGKADDLKKIEGIGPVLEERLNEWGIFHYDQIAAWGADEVAYADNNVPRFKGRCSRDKWVAQAKIIVSEGLEAFLERAKTNDY